MLERIVTDERRPSALKSARRCAVVQRKPLVGVACLRVAAATCLRSTPCQRLSLDDPDYCQLSVRTLKASVKLNHLRQGPPGVS